MAAPEHDLIAFAETEEGVVEHGGAHAESAFPPFDPTHFPSQLFWLTLIFVALYLYLSRVALPRVATVIEERQDKVASDLDQAGDLKRQAEDAEKAYHQALADARARAGKIAADTRASLDSEIKEMQADADGQIATKMAEADKRIAKAKDDALANVRDIAAQTAQGVVKKLIGADVDGASASQAVNAALTARE